MNTTSLVFKNFVDIVVCTYNHGRALTEREFFHPRSSDCKDAFFPAFSHRWPSSFPIRPGTNPGSHGRPPASSGLDPVFMVQMLSIHYCNVRRKIPSLL